MCSCVYEDEGVCMYGDQRLGIFHIPLFFLRFFLIGYAGWLASHTDLPASALELNEFIMPGSLFV